MKTTKVIARIIQQLVSITLLTSAASVQALGIIYTVDSQQMFNATGISASPGQVFQFQASGSANLASLDGTYITDPNGTILVAPPSGTVAYNFFTTYTDPRGVAPAVGNHKSVDGPFYGGQAPLTGGNYGALVAGFSSLQNPTAYTDFTGFTVIGTLGSVTAPSSGGYLFLSVNDNNYIDNTGSYTVQLVPEPAALPLALVGAAFFGWMRRRRHNA